MTGENSASTASRGDASSNRSTRRQRFPAERLNLEHIDAPGGLIDIEPAASQIVAVALVDFVVDHVLEAKAPAAQFRKRQHQVALAASWGVVHDDDMRNAVLAGPGTGHEAIRASVAGPGRGGMDLRPVAAAKRIGLSQQKQQFVVETGNLTVDGFDRPATKVRRHAHARSIDLALLEEAQARREEGDCGGGSMLRPGEGGRRAGFVVVLEEARESVLVVEAGIQVVAHGVGVPGLQAVIQSLVVAIVEALLLQR